VLKNHIMKKRIAGSLIFVIGLAMSAGIASAQYPPSTTTTTATDVGAGGEERGDGAAPGTGTGGTGTGAAVGGSGLPRTGTDADVPAKLGIGLVALGGIAVLTVRKRRQSPASAS
jgi:LPXTG-motif cell wall-anchored protein